MTDKEAITSKTMADDQTTSIHDESQSSITLTDESKVHRTIEQQRCPSIVPNNSIDEAVTNNANNPEKDSEDYQRIHPESDTDPDSRPPIEVKAMHPSVEVVESTVDDASWPKPVVICGPSGVGKGTLIEMLMKKFPNEQFGFSVSHTTRKPRDGEVDGVHYNFSTVEVMKSDIEAGKFIEYAEVHGNFYGTSVASVESVRSQGKVCILDIDVQGARNVKKSCLNPIYIFIAPPSMELLESRLRGRGTEKEEDIMKRLGNAADELAYGEEEGNFDRLFVNADLGTTFSEMTEDFKAWYPQLTEVADESTGTTDTTLTVDAFLKSY